MKALSPSKASGISNMEQWMAAKTPVKMGTTGPGAFDTDSVIKVIKEAKQLIEVGIHYPSKITKTLALPPGTPNDRT